MVSAGLLVAIAASILLAIPTVFAILNFVRSLRHRKYQASLYEDEDGTATEESQKNFIYKPQVYTLLSFSLCAFGLALATSVLAHIQNDETSSSIARWLLFGDHIFAVLQSFNIVVEKQPVRRFQFATHITLSYLILLIALVFSPSLGHISRNLAAADFALCVCALAVSTTIPRRPDVYYKGKVVDGQRTVSLLSKVTFTWPGYLLGLARSKNELALHELPATDHTARAEPLHALYPRLEPHESLLGLMFKSHAKFLALQYLFTLVQAIFNIGPQIALYSLLKALEDRYAGHEPKIFPQTLAAILGVAVILQALSEGWMWFISNGQIMTPMRVQLSALIFAKAMRRKDVKGAANTDIKDGNHEESDEDEKANTKQGTVNLIGIDTKRVGDFAALHNWFFGALCKLLLAFGFLASLTGWIPVAVGLAVQLATIPLNVYFSKKYTAAQNRLMKIRDRKLNVLNELLTGIRHIKFAAMEEKVEKQIHDFRGEELNVQWSSFVADTFLIFCWIAGPVLLGAACLVTYALINKTLSASIAFTIVGVLDSINATLAFLPELTTHGLDAWVSLKRIQAYLHAPERMPYTERGETVQFQNADIAWPSDDEEAEREFIIRDATIKFPRNELSVISGHTGSGKSLLLAAILGEADLLGGKVRLPDNSKNLANDNSRNKGIDPSAIAFVSQQPWIENATFRDNILFGLPYSKERFEKVIAACALEADRKLLSDGDDTEIGANGINLSGGQKWRITLARALYSRAGILVMDDIFSAVDAHVGRHIFEQAICGELCDGRTTILATHHVSLVLPKAKYAVHLSNGSIEHAGDVEKLEQSGAVQQLIEAEAEDSAITEEDELPELSTVRTNQSHRSHRSHSLSKADRELSPAHPLRRRMSVISHITDMTEAADELNDVQKVETAVKEQPRKFVEEETKKTGRVPITLYKQYLKASGGYAHWTFIMIIFAAYELLILGHHWWITLWTQSYDTENEEQPRLLAQQVPAAIQFFSMKANQVDDKMKFYLSIYLVLSLSQAFGGSLRYFIVFIRSIVGSKRLFSDLTYAVLRAPLRWLDTVPVGRVLNRFTTDFNVIDSDLAMCIGMTVYNGLLVIGILFAGYISLSPQTIACY
jgi:ABC-type multidrug transport system fused ATPase/permease subunit